MPDYLGNIPVPEITPSGVFPLVPDYPHGRAQAPEVVIHPNPSVATGTRWFGARAELRR